MRAKFHCWTVEERGEDAIEVTMGAVQSDENLENQDFNKYTPDGELRMYVDNPKAKEFFKEGKEYYLDFSEAKE